MVAVTFDITILLFAAMVGIVLAKRFGQSAIVGEILIGVVIGPTLLGWVHYDESVRLLAELGSIFMLFAIGLQSDVRSIGRLKNFWIALAGVIVPFFLGWWTAHLFGLTGIEGLFVGTALTATSIAITARILQERGLLESNVAKTIIGAAVIDDVLGLIVLAIISGVSGASGWSALGGKIALAILFVVACFVFVRPINRFVRWTENALRAHTEHAGLFIALVVAFGYAAIAQALGLSGIVGAFLAGVTLEAFESSTVRGATHYLETIFSAIFFVSLGVVMDFTTLGGAWLLALALIAVAVVSKLVGCFVVARLSGDTTRDALSIGFGMVPRGEVAMIVALIGITAGIVTPPVYGAIIVMAFATTILTPVLLHWSLARPHGSRSQTRRFKK